MLIITDRFRAAEQREALADYLNWEKSTDDLEAEPEIWPLTVPDPGVDLRPWQAMLEKRFGFEAGLPNFRIRWAGTLFQRVLGVDRLQYTYPMVAEAQVKVIRIPSLDDKGVQKRDATGTLEFDDLHLPFDESTWPEEYQDWKGTIGLKNYIVERAIPLYVIQELAPAYHANKGRDDTKFDASGGIYQLAVWCSSDDTERGEYREPLQRDIEQVALGLKLRAEDLRHSIQGETPAEYRRRRIREMVRAKKRSRAIRDEEARQEKNERLVKKLVDKAGIAPSSVAWSIPGITHKKGHR